MVSKVEKWDLPGYWTESSGDVTKRTVKLTSPDGTAKDYEITIKGKYKNLKTIQSELDKCADESIQYLTKVVLELVKKKISIHIRPLTEKDQKVMEASKGIKSIAPPDDKTVPDDEMDQSPKTWSRIENWTEFGEGIRKTVTLTDGTNRVYLVTIRNKEEIGLKHLLNNTSQKDFIRTINQLKLKGAPIDIQELPPPLPPRKTRDSMARESIIKYLTTDRGAYNFLRHINVAQGKKSLTDQCMEWIKSTYKDVYPGLFKENSDFLPELKKIVNKAVEEVAFGKERTKAEEDRKEELDVSKDVSKEKSGTKVGSKGRPAAGSDTGRVTPPKEKGRKGA